MRTDLFEPNTTTPVHSDVQSINHVSKKRVRSCSSSSLDWIAIGMPVSRQRWGLNCTLPRGSKAAEALHKPLHKILPTMPNKLVGCRLLPTHPTDSVESSE